MSQPQRQRWHEQKIEIRVFQHKHCSILPQGTLQILRQTLLLAGVFSMEAAASVARLVTLAGFMLGKLKELHSSLAKAKDSHIEVGHIIGEV